ncbi:MAG: SIS domain-containing protein [Magnetococcales bacterium]|nr:SIS domain-containing protein [Magnetococcales bacterium]
MSTLEKLHDPDPVIFARAYIGHLCEVLQRIDPLDIAGFIATLLEARERGATIFFMGNGGSAATASHFANDLAIGTRSPHNPFRALAITDNLSVMTAIANDEGYAAVFARQLQILGRPGDVVVGISASGNSPNLLRAFETAKEMGIKCVALTAFDGGTMRAMADEGIHVPTDPKEYGPAEDAHMVLDHLVGAYLMERVRRGG